MGFRKILIFLCFLALVPFVMGQRGGCAGGRMTEPGEVVTAGEIEELAVLQPSDLPPPGEPPPEVGKEDLPPPDEDKGEKTRLTETVCKLPEEVPPITCLTCTRYLPLDAEAVASFHWRELYRSRFIKDALPEGARDLREDFMKLETEEGIPLGGIGLNRIDTMCVAGEVRRWMKDVPSEDGGGGPFDMFQQFVFILESTDYPEDFSLLRYVKDNMPGALEQGKVVYDEGLNAFKQYNARFDQYMFIGFMDGRLALGTENYFYHVRKMADLPKPLSNNCPRQAVYTILPPDADVLLAGNNVVVGKLLEDDKEESSGEGTDVEVKEGVEFEHLFVLGALDRFVAGLDVDGKEMWVAVHVLDKAGLKTGNLLLNVNPASLDVSKLSQLLHGEEEPVMPPEPLGTVKDQVEQMGTAGEPL